MKIRYGDKRDLMVLRELLFEAFFWDPNMVRPKINEFFENPEVNKLIADWDRPGDKIVIAEEYNQIIGAGWLRLWTDSNHSYGYINCKIPELGIAVFPNYRSKGVGRLILKEVIESAKSDGLEAIILSVSPENFALKLYESFGFKKVGKSGTSWTYKLVI